MWNIHKLKDLKNDINKFKKKKLCCGPLVQHCNVIVEITDIKCRLLSKHLFQGTQEHGGFTKPLGNDKLV